MNKKRNWRAIFTWLLAVFALAYVLPSAVSMPGWWPFTKEIRGGLDLAGGLELRYTVDWKQTIEDTTRKTAEGLQRRIAHAVIASENKNASNLSREELDSYVGKMSIKVEDMDRVSLILPDEATWQVYEGMNRDDRGIDERMELSNDKGSRTITVLMPDVEAQSLRKQVVAETRDNLEKRVGSMGLIDPDVRVTGDSDIAVQVPGVDESQMDVVRSVLGRTAQLTMRFVEPTEPYLTSPEVQQQLEAFKAANPAIEGLESVMVSGYGSTIRAKNKSELARFIRTLEIPDNRAVGYSYEELDTDGDGIVDEKFWQALTLRAKVELTGSHIARARSGYTQEGRPAVYLDMNGEGAELFSNATGENVGEYLAILLDEDVESAPVIRTKISGGRAEITMGAGGQRALDEANALVSVLNQGAFQAPVYKVHDHAVGPSLGQDSVEAGATALVVGFLAIYLFMILYYRVSGAIATVVLTFNVLLVFMLLVSFNTALTLPGIAGLILSLGMAVDGNVLIYERIREEIREGRSPRVSVDLGFGHALSSIVDGQLTTALVGLVLMNFTSGPVYNFAVTLIIGIATSIFTSVFVSRLIFNYWVNTKKPKTISI